jgi:hypothetical protein
MWRSAFFPIVRLFSGAGDHLPNPFAEGAGASGVRLVSAIWTQHSNIVAGSCRLTGDLTVTCGLQNTRGLIFGLRERFD